MLTAAHCCWLGDGKEYHYHKALVGGYGLGADVRTILKGMAPLPIGAVLVDAQGPQLTMAFRKKQRYSGAKPMGEDLCLVILNRHLQQPAIAMIRTFRWLACCHFAQLHHH